MAKSFTPSFAIPATAKVAFTTNNPFGEDRMSDPVMITNLKFNEVTRSIEATGSDKRMRQCRIDRFNNDAQVKALSKTLQDAFNKRQLVQFVAAGANDPSVWFFNVVLAR